MRKIWSRWLRPFRRTARIRKESAPPPEEPYYLNLGIDFGTSFTKVSFRDVAERQTVIVTFDACENRKGGSDTDGEGGISPEDAMIPSIVSVGAGGALSLGRDSDEGKSRERYLKMRLADLEISGASESVGRGDEKTVQVLSSWFLATVISRARIWIHQNEKERLAGREDRIEWSVNLGVPVEHHVSPVKERFSEALSIAWVWATRDEIPDTVQSATESYESLAGRVDRERLDCHVIPEIKAAVQPFLTSRAAEHGIVYVYFDIGGGTVDGAAFKYLNWGGERTVAFYSGKVDPLGVSAREHHILRGGSEESLRDEVQALVATVIIGAKEKDGRDWRREVIQDESMRQRRAWRKEFSSDDAVPLPVFMGGGGADMDWYRDAVSSTYHDFDHHKAGIPPYDLVKVPRPADLDLKCLNEKDFGRFTIAYGLSIPHDGGVRIKLPDEIEPMKNPDQWKPPGGRYEDSKDSS